MSSKPLSGWKATRKSPWEEEWPQRVKLSLFLTTPFCAPRIPGLLGQPSLWKCKRTGTFPCWSTKALCLFCWLRSFNQPRVSKVQPAEFQLGWDWVMPWVLSREASVSAHSVTPGWWALPVKVETVFYDLSHHKSCREQGDEIPLYPSLSNNYYLAACERT